ncbi:MAG TPA: hypothetical protein VJY62_10470 [Bacteroidia bacterium]|nr:hypothetical protein [Bacteroidia bacterium]
MVPEIRKKYNSIFTEEKFHDFLKDMNAEFNYTIPFRVAESPVFIPKEFKHKINEACDGIISFLMRDDFKKVSEKAIPAHLNVPNESEHTLFLAIDFGVCKDENGEINPQLIELQGFPSLFGWQHYLAKKYRQHFYAPENYDHLFSGLDEESYVKLLKKSILGDHEPQYVILLEIEPKKQNTRIDFLLTEQMLGVKSVCISDIIKEDDKLFYVNKGKIIPIHRIYNRVIFDELIKRDDLKLNFKMTDDVNVEWAGHPNWFYRISKYLMPRLKSKYIPPSYFLNELKTIPGDLENYVLKPLFSFSGSGIKFNVTKEDIDEIEDPENYMLQKKVKYEPVLQSPDEAVKVEVRMLYLWEPKSPKPELIINMARLSKGEMIGVKYNLNKNWVGGSVGFYET